MASSDRGKRKGSYPYWQWFKNSDKRKKPKSKEEEPLGFGDSASCSKAAQWKEPIYEEGVQLSDQQEHVLNLIRQGKNVFYTGNAGTGKTTLLREIRKCAPEGTYVTALTGVAAVQAGGVTLHSFAGIGLGNGTKEYLCDIVRRSSKAKNWKNAKVLIIDEVSMLDGRLFDKLEYIARQVRNNDLPFGGLQLVMCGDFFQLPPIQKVGETSINYCFQSKSWSKCLDYSIELTQIYRQSDPKLIKLLYEVRYQCISDESLELLNHLNRPLSNTGDMEPTKLYSHNARVNDINNAKLIQLPGEEMVYTAQDHGQRPYADNMGKYVIAMDSLVLKIGAQVMLLKNLTEDLINGSRGVVQGFDHDGWPIVQFVDGQLKTIKEVDWNLENSSGKVLAVRIQVPLKLAWAITIHKSQGMSIDLLQVDLKHVFSQGQAYVALSRARTLEGLQVLSFDTNKFTTSDEVIKFYQDKVKPAPTKQSCTGQEISTSNFLTPTFLRGNVPRTPMKRKRSSKDDDDYGNACNEHFSQKSLDEIKVSDKRVARQKRGDSRSSTKTVDVVVNDQGTSPLACKGARYSNMRKISPETSTCSNSDVKSFTRVPTSTKFQANSFPCSLSFSKSSKGFQKASQMYLSQNQSKLQNPIKEDCGPYQYKSPGREQSNEMTSDHSRINVLDYKPHSIKEEFYSRQLKSSGKEPISVLRKNNKGNDNHTLEAFDYSETVIKISPREAYCPADDSNEFDYLFDDNGVTDSECLRASQEAQQDSLELFSDDFSDSGSGLQRNKIDDCELKIKNKMEISTVKEPRMRNEMLTVSQHVQNVIQESHPTPDHTPLTVKRNRRRSSSSSSKLNELQQTTHSDSLDHSSFSDMQSPKDSSAKRRGSSASKNKTKKTLEHLKERSKRKCSLLFENLKDDTEDSKEDGSLATEFKTTGHDLASSTTTLDKNSFGGNCLTNSTAKCHEIANISTTCKTRGVVPDETSDLFSIPSTEPFDLQSSQLRSKERSSQLFDFLKEGSENNSENVQSGCRKTLVSNTSTRTTRSRTRHKQKSDERSFKNIIIKKENCNDTEKIEDETLHRIPQSLPENEKHCNNLSVNRTIHSQYCSPSRDNHQEDSKLQTISTQTECLWHSSNYVVQFQVPGVSLVVTDLLNHLFCLMLKVAIVLHQFVAALYIEDSL